VTSTTGSASASRVWSMRRASSAVAMPFSVTITGTPPVTCQALRTPRASAAGKYSQPVSVV